MHKEVIDTMTEVMHSCYGNPSSTHAYGRNAKASIELVRKQIAVEFGVTTPEIVFTSGGTESNNMILRCAVKKFGIQRIISSKIEHKCVKETTKDLTNSDIELDYVALDKKGSVIISDLEEKLNSSDKPTLVTLMHANNEIGNILNIQKVAEICKENNVLLHTDTVQTVAHYKMNFNELGIDFASGAAHKFHGPKGVGFAFFCFGYPPIL